MICQYFYGLYLTEEKFLAALEKHGASFHDFTAFFLPSDQKIEGGRPSPQPLIHDVLGIITH